MKVLITGSNGFIGQHLVSNLRNEKGISLVLSSRKYVESLSDLAEQFIFSSIDSSTNWGKVLAGVDTVVHLAGIAHDIKLNFKNSDTKYIESNIKTTSNLAKQAVKAGVKRFVYLSSIKVNGEETFINKPFMAEDIPDPQDSYAKSKLNAEIALKEISKISDLELVIIRPVLVYGPGVKGNFLNLMKWIKRGIPLPFALIKNKRDLVSVDNLVNFITICLKHPSAVDQVFLISDNISLSTKNLIKKIARFQKKKIFLLPFPKILLNLVFNLIGRKELSQKLLGSLEVNIQKNINLVGWRPSQDVDEVLKETVEFFTKYHDV